jgi:HEAT repeat protein
VVPALKRGLGDEHAGVRLNAAYGLALRGDASGLDLLERSLDHASLARLGVHPDMHQAALTNAMRGIVSLASRPAATSDPALAARLEGLRGRMETLAREDGDQKVRQLAREGLDRWRKN